jgi:hypothetical protein
VHSRKVVALEDSSAEDADKDCLSYSAADKRRLR